MCFTLIGRLQTRLFSLIWPLVVTALFASTLRERGYWFMFAVMVVVAFALDLGVYGWALRYQPRWLTIALGVAEFFVIQFVAAALPTLKVLLTVGEAATFYVVAWLGAWVTMQMVLPLLWPRWAENGGECR
ncbi:MAG: hypothetical protein ABI874_02285 [Chloroflexota bacterium]